jgi:hypothetical protein
MVVGSTSYFYVAGSVFILHGILVSVVTLGVLLLGMSRVLQQVLF